MLLLLLLFETKQGATEWLTFVLMTILLYGALVMLTQVKQARKRDYQQHHHYQHFSSSFSILSLTSIHTHTNAHFFSFSSLYYPFTIQTEPIQSYPCSPPPPSPSPPPPQRGVPSLSSAINEQTS